MKVNINKIDSVYEVLSKENTKTHDNKIKSTNDAVMDKVEISSKAKEFNQIKSIVNKVIENVNEVESPERLQKLKTEIAIGKYKIASEDIAEAIINTGYKKNK
ncbi:MAG: hypothetical protein K0S55_203 [Clostridia bacterium]|nr:hypothetical protein [Clostridia bacterium]